MTSPGGRAVGPFVQLKVGMREKKESRIAPGALVPPANEFCCFLR